MTEAITEKTMTAKEITTIDKNYKEAEKVFQSSVAYIAKEKLDNIIGLRALKLTDEYETYSLDGNEITLNIIDREGDSGTYCLPFDIFLNKTAKEINSHDSVIGKKIHELHAERNKLHTGDYLRTRDAIKTASSANMKIEIPRWYNDANTKMESKFKEIEELAKSKYMTFSW